jgi:hypothetical protein
MLASSEGSQSRQAVKYGYESRGTRNQRITVLARASSNLVGRPSSNVVYDSQSRGTVKYGHDSHGTWNQECAGEDQQQFTRPDKSLKG